VIACETFAQVQAGKRVNELGGISNAMAIRHVAAHGYYDDEETLANVARKAMFTHTSEEALSGGEFFARVTHRVIHGVQNTVSGKVLKKKVQLTNPI